MRNPQRYHENHSALYLASGARGDFRETLTQFGSRTLVDHLFRTSQCELRPRSSRLEKIKGNAEDVLIDLYLLGRKYDCLVILNEGLWEGGGCYPLHRGATMGLASLVLGSYYIHVTLPSYYGDDVCNLRTELLDLPFVRDEIDLGDRDRVDSAGLSPNKVSGVRQWRMARVAATTRSNLIDYPYTLHWKSVWHDADVYDAVFLPEYFQGNFWHRLSDLTTTPVLRMHERFRSCYGAWQDHTPLIGEKPPVVCPIDYCLKHGIKRIALVPSNPESARDLISHTAELNASIDLHFYHLRWQRFEHLYPKNMHVQVLVPGMGLPFQ